jgi:hypothetical protein
VRDVAALTATDQQHLMRWLDRCEWSQVLSTSAQSLFSLVERGQFLADLFYRLNVFRFDVAMSGYEGASFPSPMRVPFNGHHRDRTERAKAPASANEPCAHRRTRTCRSKNTTTRYGS